MNTNLNQTESFYIPFLMNPNLTEVKLPQPTDVYQIEILLSIAKEKLDEIIGGDEIELELQNEITKVLSVIEVASEKMGTNFEWITEILSDVHRNIETIKNNG